VLDADTPGPVRDGDVTRVTLDDVRIALVLTAAVRPRVG
jgi:hypothetical protein